MKARQVAPPLFLALVLSVPGELAFAQRGPRGGRSGGHGGGHAVQRSSSSGMRHSPPGMRSSSPGMRSSYQRSHGAPPSVAQRRHPRAGTGSGSWGYYGGRYHGGSHKPYHGGRGYYGSYYGGYYRPYYGYGPYYGYSGWPYFSVSLGWPYYSSWPYYAGPYSAGWYDTGSWSTSYTYAPSYYSSEAEPMPPPEDRSSEAEAPRSRDSAPSYARGETGQLRLEVRPEDASVYVDDAFRGTARDARLLSLRPGRHTVELVRPGFAVERREVEVVKGERVDLMVELQRP